MGRSLRITYEGMHYHVTSRGNAQKNTFKSRRDREQFLLYLASSITRYRAKSGAWLKELCNFQKKMNGQNIMREKKRNIITLAFGFLFCCATISSAIMGDYRLTLAVCTFTALLLLLKYVIHPLKLPSQIDCFLQKKSNLISSIAGILFFGLLLFIIVLLLLNQ